MKARRADLRIGTVPVRPEHPGSMERQRHGEVSVGLLTLHTPKGQLRTIELDLPALLRLAASAAETAQIVERVNREQSEASS